MPKMQDDVKTIHTQRASNPRAAVIDAHIRSADAVNAYPLFFNADHLQRVRDVAQILKDFFTVHNGLHVNHRENRGKPFSVVKVSHVQWPRVSRVHKDRMYVKPIQDLGGEIVYSARTHSVLVRIRT